MKVAAAAYPLDPVATWAAYRDKQASWVAEAATHGADLLVFPEYGRMELAALDGVAAAADLETSLHAAAAHAARADALMGELARRHGVHILAASGPVLGAPGTRPMNRATLFGPGGMIGYQDKQVMTRFERETWGVRPGGPLRAFETDLGTLGILICYDAEFPLLARALVDQGAEILLVPSCTDSPAGYSRVRVGAMARALESQCVVVHSPTVGAAAWSPAVDENVGAAAIYGPPDLGFPSDGVIAQGAMDAPGWVMADCTLDAIRRVRTDGHVLNHAHWRESETRARQIADAKEFP